MTPSRNVGHRHVIGITRRELLQVGYTGLLGIGLPSLLAQQVVSAEAKRGKGKPSRKAKSVVVVFLTGAPSHIDTFDLKPEAPPEVRGEFKPIATKVPGLRCASICRVSPLGPTSTPWFARSLIGRTTTWSPPTTS